MRRLTCGALALLTVSLLSAALAAPAYADTVEPGSWAWAWLTAGAVVPLIAGVVAWRGLAGLRRRRTDREQEDHQGGAGSEPPR